MYICFYIKYYIYISCRAQAAPLRRRCPRQQARILSDEKVRKMGASPRKLNSSDGD